VLCSGWMIRLKKGFVLFEGASSSSRAHSTFDGAHKSSPSQVPTALLTTALIVLWLSLHGGDPYTNCLLKDVAIFLCVD